MGCLYSIQKKYRDQSNGKSFTAEKKLIKKINKYQVNFESSEAFIERYLKICIFIVMNHTIYTDLINTTINSIHRANSHKYLHKYKTYNDLGYSLILTRCYSESGRPTCRRIKNYHNKILNALNSTYKDKIYEIFTPHMFYMQHNANPRCSAYNSHGVIDTTTYPVIYSFIEVILIHIIFEFTGNDYKRAKYEKELYFLRKKEMMIKEEEMRYKTYLRYKILEDKKNQDTEAEKRRKVYEASLIIANF